MSKKRLQATFAKGRRYPRAGKPQRVPKSYRRIFPSRPRPIEALRSRPGDAEPLRESMDFPPPPQSGGLDLGATLANLGGSDGAIGRHCRALELNPKSPVALHDLGTALKDRGRLIEAVGCFRKVVEFAPDFQLAHHQLGAVLVQLGRTREAVNCFRRALELRPADPQVFSDLLLVLNHLPDDERAAVFTELRRFDACCARPLGAQSAPHTNWPHPARALRIGFVSGDFRDHPAACFFAPILAHCSTAEFEIFCYSNQTTPDDVTARLRREAEHWREVAALTDEELAAAIRHDAIDILVDLSGPTQGHRLLAFARKPAPIQVSMLGSLQSTGLSAMDYRITDEGRDPAGAGELCRVEELVRLPAGALTFLPPAECPPVNELPALRNGFVTFGAFSNPASVTPEALAAWAEILRALPTARLLVIGREGDPVQKSLVEQGIATGRIEVIPQLPLKAYLALHHRVDLRLDTFPCNGGTTSLLAAWMGVPVVTVASESSNGRSGARLLESAGLGGLVASGPADYVQRAVVAASDLPRLAHWRTHLREKCALLFGDGASYTRQLERAFREMWRKWCATRPAAV